MYGKTGPSKWRISIFSNAPGLYSDTVPLRWGHNISSPFRDNQKPFIFQRVKILSPLRDDRKPLIFQWAFTLRNAGIGSVSNPAFFTLKN